MATMRLTIFIVLVVSLIMPGMCYDWPSLVFKENERASIPCLIEGDSAAYLWKQGDTYDTSEHFAANFDVEGGNDDRVKVLDNGTLVIHNMSSEFVARYHCRVVTENTEYRASVSLQMDAWRDDSLLFIDECQPSPECSFTLHPNESQPITCIATGVMTSDLSLRWKVKQKSILLCTMDVLERDDGSLDLTCFLDISYEMAVLLSVLSCEAYRDTVVSRYVSVSLEGRLNDTERTAIDQHDSDSSYLIGIVLLAIICGILAVVLLVVLWRNRQSRQAKRGIEADENQELIRKDGGELLRETKELKKQLEQEKRKFRSKELESKARMRAILRFKTAGGRGKVVKSEKVEHLKTKYGLSAVFQTNQSDDEVFKSIEDIVQSAVDGNTVCCVNLEAQGSKTTTDSRGSVNIDAKFQFISALMRKIFSCKEDLSKRGLELKVIVSYLAECGGTKTKYRYGCLEASAAGTGKMSVKGLTVETKMYELACTTEVIDLVKSVDSDSEKEGETPILGVLQLYLETWMDESKVSKGSLSLPFFYNEVSTANFLGMSGTVDASLRDPISDKNTKIAIVATLTQDDTSDENARILQCLEEVKNMNRKDAGDVESTSG